MSEELSALFAGRHFWLAQIAAYFVLTLLALKVWSALRRRAKKQAAGAWNAILVKAAGPPTSAILAALGARQILQTVADNVPALGWDFSPLLSLIVIAGVFWALLRLAAAAEKLCERPLHLGGANVDPSAVHAFFRVARYVIIIIALLAAMESLGVSISGLLAFGGVGGAIVAFAAKDTLSNFFSGIIVFTERPFVVGDWIRCPGTEVEGVVEKIGWRMTQMRTFDHRPLYVPNSMFSTNIIENPQRMTNRRIHETMGVRYDDIGRLPAILEDIRKMIRAHDDIDQRQFQMVNFDRYGASSLDFFVYVMTRTTKWEEFHKVKEDILLQIAAIVADHGAEFAFPTRTVHLPSGTNDAIAKEEKQ